MKTVKEWLETLPEPHRSQALENAIKHPLAGLNAEFSTLKGALASAFVWAYTTEGGYYWNTFNESINE